MDIVGIIDSAIASLPDGEHMQGLRAIRRHIGAAIRHFDKLSSGDNDCCTDAIYRCNQAFEGGLKEAYRVLAEKDPSKVTPHQIESYIEKNNIVRPRVLKQLTRYREDYRNPSAHDYKLDFDQDEALLAIVSVCAFTKLLINQISSRLAFEEGVSRPAANVPADLENIDQISEFICRLAADNLSSAPGYITRRGDEILVYLSAIFKQNNIITEVNEEKYDEFDDDPDWGIIISYKGVKIPLEVRVHPNCSISVSTSWMLNKMRNDNISHAILIISDNKPKNTYALNAKKIDGRNLYVVFPTDGVVGINEEDLHAYGYIISNN